MRKDVIIAALESIIAALTTIKNEILGKVDEKQDNTEETYNKCRLVNRLGYTYSTRHPEYPVDSQVRNLKDMIKGTKISYIISWLNKGNIEGIEGFFKLDTETKRKVLLESIEEYQKDLEDIFNHRFHTV